MKPLLIDSHCHLDDERFDDDRDAVIQRARDAGVGQFVVAATTAASWPKLSGLTRNYDGVFAAYGLHPWFMRHHRKSHVEQLDQWLEREQAVALGECGLDFYHGDKDRDDQLELFRAQISLARNHRLPVIIHARKSLDRVLRELRRAGDLRGEVHSFSGSLQQAQQLFELGFKLGIAATVSFERAVKLREVVRKIDIDALLIETDAPDQPGAAHRGQRNEPGFIVDHLKVMAELRGLPEVELATRLNHNCRSLFRLNETPLL